MAGKPGVTVKFDYTKQLVDNINRLSKLRLYVGVPDSTADRPADSTVAGLKAYKKGSTEVSPINNATIAKILNDGAPKARIKPRPFLTLGVAEAQKELVKRLERIATLATTSSDPDIVAKGFHALGLFAVNAVRKKMTDGPWPALAPATIKARKAARKSGLAGDKPLIDTGRLRQAITYVLRSK